MEMIWRGVLVLAIVIGMGVLASCTPGDIVPATLTRSAAPDPKSAPSALSIATAVASLTPARVIPNAATLPAEIALTALQARQIATVNGFFEAYNTGRRDEALAFFDAAAVFGDCDYRERRQIGTATQITVADWLAQRIADHEPIVIERIVITPHSATALGVVYARRTNDTLRSLGQPDGITPQLATKIILTADGRRIGAFSNGCG